MGRRGARDARDERFCSQTGIRTNRAGMGRLRNKRSVCSPPTLEGPLGLIRARTAPSGNYVVGVLENVDLWAPCRHGGPPIPSCVPHSSSSPPSSHHTKDARRKAWRRPRLGADHQGGRCGRRVPGPFGERVAVAHRRGTSPDGARIRDGRWRWLVLISRAGPPLPEV